MVQVQIAEECTWTVYRELRLLNLVFSLRGILAGDVDGAWFVIYLDAWMEGWRGD